jgi:uncharacterized OB-fold protein
MSNTGVVPGLTPDTAAFWTGGRNGQLLISHCAQCGNYMHPPSPICLNCRSRTVRPEPVSGFGSVYTFTINYQPWTPDAVVPFVFAMVELDEQPRLLLMTNIVNCPVEQVFIGMRVQVLFRQRDEVWLPYFEPASA